LRHGDCKALFEIVISVANAEHRPIGYFSGKQEFTIVAFAVERDGSFDPKSVCGAAKKLIQAIKEGKEHVRIFNV